ncbi:hypothetical protein DYB32_000785 [Aphanomyces invadans]|uniref:Uncharacterized protein n=1 Tax=Aphanomyces invadans TaxID=157072 RepID=A0A3R6Z5E2_9STRA|nr:hypothetical protein DYB32_000785 [Aphanomyces invadans]
MTQWTESHAGAQAELARVRAEGDWIMIKIEMEKKELDATLKEIEMAKAQIAALHTTKLHECPTAVTTMYVPTFAARMVASTRRRDLAKHVKALQTQEERYKGHVSEDLSKLALLRQAVDEARRVRKDALAAEADEQCRAKHMAGTIAATHAEIASIKQREAVMADQIRQVQADIDSDQAAFFAARKELADQLHECHKHQAKQPNERSHVQAIAGVSSAAHTYKKKSNLSWLRARNKVCLVKRTESLEKKKDLLDALLDTSKLPTVHCFLDKYLRQEADKAVMCVEIDRQSTINAAILVNIQRLEAEKTQSRDMHTMDGLNPYCQAAGATLCAHVRRLKYSRAARPVDRSANKCPRCSLMCMIQGVKMHLERLARIEEHVAQKVLSKIAHECATHNGHWQQSATLVRLLQSRGVLRPKLVQFPPPLPTSVAPVAVGPTRPSDDRDNDQDDEHDANHTDRPDHAIQRDAIVAVNSKDVLRELRECHAARALTLDDDGARHSLCKSKSRRRLSAADVRRDESIAALTTRARFPGTKLARAVADVELDCTSVMIAASSAEPKERRRSSTSVASTS